MINLAFHLLRPYWLLGFIPLILFGYALLRLKPTFQAWQQICDSHLLPHLIKNQGPDGKRHAILIALCILLCLIFSLTGPTRTRLPVPIYQQQQAHVLILDLSETMLADDLPPNRLQRAKFKLHDLFLRHDKGQFALIVYSGEAFVVSPLTDDAQTIDALLTTLSPDLMPVAGNRLDSALLEARQLMQQSGSSHGDILVLTAKTPTPLAIETARTLARDGLSISVLPMLRDKQHNSLFNQLAAAGSGHVLPFSDTSHDIDEWLSMAPHALTFNAITEDSVPTWRDDGRWFLIPALLLLLPLFRRHGLQGIRP